MFPIQVRGSGASFGMGVAVADAAGRERWQGGGDLLHLD